MATFSMGKDAVFSLDSTDGGTLVDISQYVAEVSIDATRDIKDLPRIGGNQTAKLVGPVATEFKLKIWYDPTVIGYFRAWSLGAGTATRSFAYGPAGGAAGQEKLSGEVYCGAVTEGAASEDPHSFDVTLAVDANGVTVGSY